MLSKTQQAKTEDEKQKMHPGDKLTSNEGSMT